MPRQFIRNANAPASPLFSQAVRVGNLIFISGTAGLDPATQKVAGPTIQEQTRQAILNCRNILSAAGATLADVVEVQALLARPDDFAGLNEAYAPFFPSDPPARSVARLGPELPGILVSIRMTAVLAD
jgi:2-iminobutanoate/2-iminopropanoate deaminase